MQHLVNGYPGTREKSTSMTCQSPGPLPSISWHRKLYPRKDIHQKLGTPKKGVRCNRWLGILLNANPFNQFLIILLIFSFLQSFNHFFPVNPSFFASNPFLEPVKFRLHFNHLVSHIRDSMSCIRINNEFCRHSQFF